MCYRIVNGIIIPWAIPRETILRRRNAVAVVAFWRHEVRKLLSTNRLLLTHVWYCASSIKVSSVQVLNIAKVCNCSAPSFLLILPVLFRLNQTAEICLKYGCLTTSAILGELIKKTKELRIVQAVVWHERHTSLFLFCFSVNFSSISIEAFQTKISEITAKIYQSWTHFCRGNICDITKKKNNSDSQTFVRRPTSIFFYRKPFDKTLSPLQARHGYSKMKNVCLWSVCLSITSLRLKSAD